MNCELCNEPLEDWCLDKNNTLDRCQSCTHIQRDLDKCPAYSRSHPWGGSSLFDRIRCYLTWVSIKKYLKSQKNKPKKAFEMGFGNGLILKNFLDSSIEMEGCEMELLEIGILPTIKDKFTYHIGAVEDVDLKKETFDFIYSVHVVEHLKSPVEAFQKIYNSLTTYNTGIYIVTPNGDSKGLKWFKTAWWNLEDPTHYRFFTSSSITATLKKIGFKDIKVSVPRSDSFMVEVSSFLRKLQMKKKTQNGVMQSFISKLLLLALLPFFFLLRIFIKDLSSSMVVTAKK